MSDILFETAGRAGIVTLNRPKALNALNEAMVREMADALDEWARDDRVTRVAIRAEGKAFSAGGDLRAIFEQRSGGIDFFASEYQNNTRIKCFPKPYVALIDGICMGGGVGLSMHGNYRVATEKLVFAMPEVGIGLFPDVGASYILSRLPGEAGLYLALTGARLGRDEAAALGLVTHPVDGDRLGDALDRAVHARHLEGSLDELRTETEPRDAADAAMIDRAFAGDSVAEIVERLGEEEGVTALKAAEAIARMSPTSLMVTFEEVRRAAERSFLECMAMEFRIVNEVLDGHDLYEGIRAVVIDKDRAPRWSPASLAGVDREQVEAHFEPPSGGDLDLSQFSEPAETA